MTRTRTTAAICTAAFLGAIIVANYLTAHPPGWMHPNAFGLIPVGFGLTATAGTYFAGLTFILRDTVQDAAGRLAVLALIVGGAALSYTVSTAHLALASGAAFLISETVDWLIYEPLRSRGYVRAAVASNIGGAAVDTVVFLSIAGFPLWSSFPGQMVGKLTMTVVAVAVVVVLRARRTPSPA